MARSLELYEVQIPLRMFNRKSWLQSGNVPNMASPHACTIFEPPSDFLTSIFSIQSQFGNIMIRVQLDTKPDYDAMSEALRVVC